MCGIAIHFRWNNPATRLELELLNHRGPDSSGQWMSPDARCWLGNTRLAIVDLSPCGAQPMTDRATGNVIVVNGEIYNHRSLRADLGATVSWEGTSDTETLLKGYARWGHDVLSRLKGMFAFAIYDAARQELFVARDRFGIKPLYYAIDPDGGLRAASEARVLTASPGTITAEAISGYLQWGASPERDLLYPDVHVLPAGHAMTVDRDGHMKTWRYWPSGTAFVSPPGNVVRRVRELIEKSVDEHLLSDVPVASFLSGGIDSSIITALAAQKLEHKLDTFSVGFDVAEFDETAIAQEIADRYGTRHHRIQLSQEEVIDAVTEAVEKLDLPSVDAINTYILSRAVAAHGVKVALSGLGGDELFGGYPSFRDVPWLRMIARLPRPVRRMLGAAANIGDRLADLPSDLDAGQLAAWRRRFFTDDMIRRAQLPRARELSECPVDLIDDYARVSWAELTGYMRHMLLRDADQMSMAVSLEMRVPFLDHELVEYVLGIPASEKKRYSGTKGLLVEACRDLLPASVYHRPKAGFVLPMRIWMLGPLASFVEEGLRETVSRELLPREFVAQTSEAFRHGRMHWTRVWSLVVLGHFAKRAQLSLSRPDPGSRSRRLKILRAIHTVNPASGGPIESVRQSSRILAARGHHVDIVTLDAPSDPWVRTCPVDVHALGPGYGRYGYAPWFSRWIKERHTEYDAVIVHGIWQYNSFGVWRALRGTGTPYFVFPHGMLDPWFKRTYPLKHLKKLAYWPWGEYRVLRDAAAVLFTSEEERRLARESFGLYQCRERVVSYGTAAPDVDLASAREDCLRTFPHLRGKPFLLFLGRLHPKKGCDLLIEALNAMRQSTGAHRTPHLVMAGPCADDKYLRRLKHLADGNDCPVTFTGMVTGSVKWGLLSAADAFVLPSHQENFGIAVAEAMACGTPVLISNKVNIWREIDDAGAGYVDNDDLAGTARLLERWIAAPASVRARMRDNARDRFARHFEIHRATDSLLEVLGRSAASAAAPRVILVSNYQRDAQQSMLRFSAVLERELSKRDCDVSVVAPPAIFGALVPGRRGLGKWLGYLDKFVVFPWMLRSAVRRARRLGPNVIVHICDHSNAMYTRYLSDVPHLVTCNDLLAVRSAHGEIPQNPTRWSGRILQRMILAGLNRAQQIACISEATRRDVRRLCALPESAVRLVYMGLNYPYRRRAGDEASMRIARLLSTAANGRVAALRDRPFVLHVGGNQWYKNRLGVLRIYAAVKQALGSTRVPALLMVGERFTAPMHAFVKANGLSNDVVELASVDNADLEALYSRAELLLYPSLAEGFGWPVIEAMACGCRVVTSGRPPLLEVGGSAAVYIDPDDVAAATEKTIAVLHESEESRRMRVESGTRQQQHFSTAAMIDNYLDLYHALSTASGGTQEQSVVA